MLDILKQQIEEWYPDYLCGVNNILHQIWVSRARNASTTDIIITINNTNILFRKAGTVRILTTIDLTDPTSLDTLKTTIHDLVQPRVRL